MVAKKFEICSIKRCVRYILASLFFASKRAKMKNVFYFTSKALFVLEIIKF